MMCQNFGPLLPMASKRRPVGGAADCRSVEGSGSGGVVRPSDSKSCCTRGSSLLSQVLAVVIRASLAMRGACFMLGFAKSKSANPLQRCARGAAVAG